MNRRTEEEILKFSRVNFAHRGLHTASAEVPENSLAAFRRAAEKGYGVELDVQLSKDGYVMVFHDDDLKRMTGKEGKIWDYTKDELQSLSLLGSKETIPLFEDVLNVLKEGAGPLIVELKTGPRNDELAEKTYAFLKTYPRTFCIESFNPFIVNWFRKHAPEVFRGQLATGAKDYASYPKPVQKALSGARLSFLNKPDFIAYNYQAPIPKHVEKLRKKGVLLIAWTVRKVADQPGAEKQFDSVIFEQHLPKLTY